MKSSILPTWTRLFGVLFALALFTAACGDDDVAVDDQVGDAVDDAGDEVGDATDEVTDTDTNTDTETETEGEGEAQSFEADLQSLNDSGVTGTATVELTGDRSVTVTIETSGYTGENPHAQHFHIGGNNECPGEDEAGDDELITTAEGAPAYGEVRVSLTTDGDVSADSALAVERFPTPDADGTITYERTFDLPEGVTADDISQAVVVQHGLASLGGDEAAYDGEQESSLDPSLPLEATIPAACGPLA